MQSVYNLVRKSVHTSASDEDREKDISRRMRDFRLVDAGTSRVFSSKQIQEENIAEVIVVLRRPSQVSPFWQELVESLFRFIKTISPLGFKDEEVLEDRAYEWSVVAFRTTSELFYPSVVQGLDALVDEGFDIQFRQMENLHRRTGQGVWKHPVFKTYDQFYCEAMLS